MVPGSSASISLAGMDWDSELTPAGLEEDDALDKALEHQE